MTEGTNTNYMLTDGLGSVTAGINTTAPSMDFIQYDVYGNTAEPLAIPYGFAGMRYVSAIDGYLTPNRAYSPRLGRWLQPDPLGTTPNPQTGNVYSPLKQYSDVMNLYAYVGNEPVNNRDVWGLEFELFPIGPGLGDGIYFPSLPDAATECSNWIAKELKDMNWLEELLPCPCKVSDAKKRGWRKDFKRVVHKFHYDAPCGCYRKIKQIGNRNITIYENGMPIVITIPVDSKHGQQCCYNASGNIIGAGNLQAGTPDKAGRLPKHYFKDVKMFIKCRSALGDSWVTDQYHRVRPPVHKSCE